MEDEQKTQPAEPTGEEIPAQPYKPFYLKTKIEDMMKYGKKAVASYKGVLQHCNSYGSRTKLNVIYTNSIKGGTEDGR